MQISISAYHEKTACTWCEKDAEAVTVEFYGGFLKKGPLCFKCFQQSIRVHHKQEATPDIATGSKPTAKSSAT